MIRLGRAVVLGFICGIAAFAAFGILAWALALFSGPAWPQAGAFLASPAHAHDGAAWIMRDKNYIGADGRHCCGPTDCAVAMPGELAREGDAWVHRPTGTMLRDGARGVYGNPHDLQLWRCVSGGTAITGGAAGARLRCVFSAGGT